MTKVTSVQLTPWTADDLWLLRRKNEPGMTSHLGGPESEEKLLARHERYTNIEATGKGHMLKILVDGEVAGSIGFWHRVWDGEPVYETGWAVLPEFQGRGVAAAAALAAVGLARAEAKHRCVHAFPSVDHPASNGVCRKAGFTLMGECEIEYPKGTWMKSNNWRLELRPER
jgi:RimJ/RimL family protein N-acetyltransferase